MDFNGRKSLWTGGDSHWFWMVKHVANPTLINPQNPQVQQKWGLKESTKSKFEGMQVSIGFPN